MGTASIHHNDRPDSDSSGDDSPEEKTIIITGSNHHGGQNKGHEGKNTRPFTKRAAHPLAKGIDSDSGSDASGSDGSASD